MSRIAIIDADLVGRKRHRFPNLVCMKLSANEKEQGNDVELKMDYEDLNQYDKVYLAKVFLDTPVPPEILEMKNVTYGGTGFFYDKAPKLPVAIEHHMPDYHLYDGFVNQQIAAGKRPQEFDEYLNSSIGYLTRGCFRHCPFCVNKNYNRVEAHSPLSEFLDGRRKVISLLDDNFFGYAGWKDLLLELRATGKPFKFKQGLDERLLTPEMCELLFTSKYAGDFTFAFDNIKDARLIERKIVMARQYTEKALKFYCFCGYDREGKWDAAFWTRDIFELLYRIEILVKYHCIPYVMRFYRYTESPWRGVYISIARWCNQPGFFKKMSLRQFAELNGEKSACYRYLAEFEKANPAAGYFFDLKF